MNDIKTNIYIKPLYKQSMERGLYVKENTKNVIISKTKELPSTLVQIILPDENEPRFSPITVDGKELIKAIEKCLL